jgi:protein SCO1
MSRRFRFSMRRLVPLALGLLLVTGCTGGPRLEMLWDTPAFTLTDAADRPFGSDQLAGKVWLVDFIYTNCPDECPLYLSPKMAALQKELLDRKLAGQVDLVSLTVDPKRDTPAVLADYAARYGADGRIWHFLTGPDAMIQGLLQNGFKVGSALPAVTVQVGGTPQAVGTPGAIHAHAAQGDASYSVAHTTYFLLVDRHGKIRATYDGEQVKVEDMLKGAQALLKES